MSTRGLTGFRVDGKLKAMYNHSDSYPGGRGQEMVDLVRRIVADGKVAQMREMARDVIMVDEGDAPQDEWRKVYDKYYDGSVNADRGTWYNLLRHLQGADIIEAVAEGRVIHMIDDSEFLNDSLFCEYAYIVNVDDVLMIQFTRSARFVHKAVAQHGIELLFGKGQDLQSHDAVHGQLLGLEDFAHAAGADFVYDAVVAELIAGLQDVAVGHSAIPTCITRDTTLFTRIAFPALCAPGRPKSDDRKPKREGERTSFLY